MLRKTLFVGLCCVIHYNFAGNTSSSQSLSREEASLADVIDDVNNRRVYSFQGSFANAITHSSNLDLTYNKILVVAKMKYTVAAARTGSARSEGEVKDSEAILTLLQQTKIEKS